MATRKLKRSLRQIADKYGFEFTGVTGKTHGRWVHRTIGCVVFTSNSPSDHRHLSNVEREFKRAAAAGRRDRKAGSSVA